MKFNFYFILVFCVLGKSSLWSQNATSFWTSIKENTIAEALDQRHIVPNLYHTKHLDRSAIASYLTTAPTESEVLQGEKGLLLDIPNMNGEIMQFEIWEAPMMHPDLAAKFPSIKTYAGHSVGKHSSIVYLDITPIGFHAMIFNAGSSTVFIDPYSKNNIEDYIVYNRKDFTERDGNTFTCHTGEKEVTKLEIPASPDFVGTCGTRREYRLALACTGEYGTFHQGSPASVANVLAAMVVTMNRVNGVFQKEFSVKLNIIANNNLIIYLDGATDPYTNNDGNLLLGENQANVDMKIGSGNYDIGHVFSTGGGGVATLFSPCNNSTKARGVTGLSAPVGDPFDIDYVAHEIGHQFSGNHNQSNNCQRSATTAVEPGSGSTIMAYAGVCSPNVQNNSDAYFNAASLTELVSFSQTGGGNSCDAPFATGNNAPVVAALTNKSIPKSTPFFLTGSATDPDAGTALTYCWEQTDLYTSVSDEVPQPTNTTGCMFRTLTPTSDPTRYFPKLSTVLSGGTDMWEVLPSVGRTMNFRLTVRDNVVNGGCTHERNVTITTVVAAGPFIVTAPNGGESYTPGSTQTITWNVANTTAAPVSCANVTILVSLDGGLTFTTLLASTPNDGTQSVTMPNTTSTTARIMVGCADNIFYDVSDNDFALGVICNQTFMSTDVPKVIPVTAGTTTSTLGIASAGNIIDVNVVNLTGTHSWINDLTIKIKSPSNTERTLFANICNDQDNFNVQFDDQASNLYASLPCPPTSGLFYRPFQTLSNFNGQSVTGTWTLSVIDGFNQDGGFLNTWGLSFCSATALPVEWLSFRAEHISDLVRLDWATATERDNKGFHIERSINDVTHFETIGWVATSNGFTPSNQYYGFVDAKIKSGNTYYYRLKQEDLSGKMHYSETRAVAIANTKGQLVITPNPTTESAIIALDVPDIEDVLEVQLYNIQGQLAGSFQIGSGTRIDLSNFAAGIYMVAVRYNNNMYYSKLIKQ
jgi:subtilisin-like proprotein convertase family protein